MNANKARWKGVGQAAQVLSDEDGAAINQHGLTIIVGSTNGDDVVTGNATSASKADFAIHTWSGLYATNSYRLDVKAEWDRGWRRDWTQQFTVARCG